MNTQYLNKDLKLKIQKDGYVIISNFLSSNEILNFRNCISNQKRKESLSIEGLNSFPIEKKITDIIKNIVGDKLFYPFLSKPVNELYESQGGKSLMHNDVHEEIEDYNYDKTINIYNTGIYLQDHDELDGGLKVRPGSHQKICIENLTFLLKMKRIIRLIFKKPKNLRYFQIFRTLLPYKSKNLKIKAGDLVIWNLRLHHSGNAKRLKFFKNFSLSTYIENFLPDFFTLKNKVDRMAIFTVYIGECDFKDKYINTQINEKHIEIWRNSKINHNNIIQKMEKNKIFPVRKVLAYFSKK